MKITAHPVPVVRSYEDQQKWIEHALAVLFEHVGEDGFVRLLEASGKFTLSTAFSGTGGLETADRILRCALRRFVGPVSEPPAPTMILLCFYILSTGREEDNIISYIRNHKTTTQSKSK